jgi:CubicO group peptidase (beta-lactamase class C family)
MYRLILILVALILMSSQAPHALERFLQEVVEREHFSGVVLVVHRGKVLLNKGYGMATAKDANDQETLFHACSLVKQFTAAAILKLWEAGELDLQASINRYLPLEYQCKRWEKVTLHHLLSHTGGIVDFYEAYCDPKVNGFCCQNVIREIIREAQEKELEFDPGTSWNYCNLGYTLLGSILEQATGLRYGEVIRKTIFDPVGMSSSFIHEDDYIEQKNHATGFCWNEAQKKFVEDTEKYDSVTPSDGGLVTTSGDMYKWSHVLSGKRPEILSLEILKRMTTPVPNTLSPNGRYGYGLFIDDSSGALKIHHPGRIVGYRSCFCFYPEKEIYIVVLCNNSSVNPKQISSGLYKTVLQFSADRTVVFLVSPSRTILSSE